MLVRVQGGGFSEKSARHVSGVGSHITSQKNAEDCSLLHKSGQCVSSIERLEEPDKEYVLPVVLAVTGPL